MEPDRPDRRLVLAAAVVALLLIFLGLVAGTWWIGSPQTPTIEDLTAPSSETPGEETDETDAMLDAEQQAFSDDDAARHVTVDESLRRAARSRERQAERERLARADLTDRDAVDLLAGRWRLDVGRRRPAVVTFDDRPHHVVDRESYSVTAFRVSGVRWPFYTVAEFTDGQRMVVFLDDEGRYRDLLEDFEVVSPRRIEYRLLDSRRRSVGVRVDR